jgi:hypothetical protein
MIWANSVTSRSSDVELFQVSVIREQVE